MLNGKQLNLGPDKKKAFEEFYRLMLDCKETRVHKTSEAFATLADRFLEWVHRKRSPETYEWYRYRLERFVRKFPDMVADEVRPHHVEAWVDDYDFSVTSRRNYMRVVKRCMSWAVKQGLLSFNPVAMLEVPAAENREIVFSESEFEELLRLIRNPSLTDLVITTWETGCRPQESLRVESRHVDGKHRASLGERTRQGLTFFLAKSSWIGPSSTTRPAPKVRCTLSGSKRRFEPMVPKPSCRGF